MTVLLVLRTPSNPLNAGAGVLTLVQLQDSNTDPPLHTPLFVAEGTRVKLRFNEYVVLHRLLPSSSNDDDDTSHSSS